MARDFLPPGLRQIEQQVTARSSRRVADEDLSDEALAKRIRLKAERHEWAGRGSFLAGAATAIGFLALLL